MPAVCALVRPIASHPRPRLVSGVSHSPPPRKYRHDRLGLPFHRLGHVPRLPSQPLLPTSAAANDRSAAARSSSSPARPSR
jgi:hypothetical protein